MNKDCNDNKDNNNYNKNYKRNNHNYNNIKLKILKELYKNKSDKK